jgi:hypothetical protein
MVLSPSLAPTNTISSLLIVLMKPPFPWSFTLRCSTSLKKGVLCRYGKEDGAAAETSLLLSITGE